MAEKKLGGESQSVFYAGKNVSTRRTLRLIVSVVLESFPELQVFHCGQPVGAAYLYSCHQKISDEQLDSIRSKILGMIRSDLPIERSQLSVEEFEDQVPDDFRLSKSGALRVLSAGAAAPTIPCYKIGDKVRWAHGPALESTGGVGVQDIAVARPTNGSKCSFIASFAPKEHYKEQTSIVESVQDIIHWADYMGVSSISSLNSIAPHSDAQSDFILHSEFRQDGKISDIANMVLSKGTVRLICIAGPTSSGKTTFATKLSIFLRNHGLKAIPLTVDHYYLPLNRQPKYQIRQLRSDVDYDAIESMDVDLINEHLNALLRGEAVMTPEYCMKTGYRIEPGNHFQIEEGGILVIEGIHALNPQYTKTLSHDKVFKVFLSPITQLRVDEAHVMKSTDSRLFRRMCRDFLFRGHSGSKTLRMWKNVRKGEDKWIFPFQNGNDYTMNSALEYEICVLKPLAESILFSVPVDDPEYPTAQRLLKLLSRVNAWEKDLIPKSSILREFLGGGVFDKH